jgi:hypothetical protein
MSADIGLCGRFEVPIVVGLKFITGFEPSGEEFEAITAIVVNGSRERPGRVAGSGD